MDSDPGTSRGGLALQRSFRGRLAAFLAERGIAATLFVSASVATVASLAIFLTLLLNGRDFFAEVSLVEFLTGTSWAPDFLPREFGALPLIKATFQIGIGAALIGVPLGIGTAIYLSEFASSRVRSLTKPAIELLAGVPSIIFGIVALFVIAPIVQGAFGRPTAFSALNAVLMLGIMVLPIITTIAEDAIRGVPRHLREGALALGATRWEATWGVVVPAAASGLTAAVLLGFGRAIGETMVVTLAAGLVPNMEWSLVAPMETITAFIANRAGGDLPTGSVEYLALFALGTVLFLFTFAINAAAAIVLTRQRRRYA